MATRVSSAAAIAACNAIVDLPDVGGAGTVQIRTGTPPTNVGDSATGTLLGTLTLSATAFGNAIDDTDKATATANTITGDSSADADGTAGYFRVRNNAGTAIWQGTVTATGGGGDMELDTVTINTGDTINISTWTFSVAET